MKKQTGYWSTLQRMQSTILKNAFEWLYCVIKDKETTPELVEEYKTRLVIVSTKAKQVKQLLKQIKEYNDPVLIDIRTNKQIGDEVWGIYEALEFLKPVEHMKAYETLEIISNVTEFNKWLGKPSDK